jgi:hypothetical protein
MACIALVINGNLQDVIGLNVDTSQPLNLSACSRRNTSVESKPKLRQKSSIKPTVLVTSPLIPTRNVNETTRLKLATTTAEFAGIRTILRTTVNGRRMEDTVSHAKRGDTGQGIAKGKSPIDLKEEGEEIMLQMLQLHWTKPLNLCM